MDVEKEDVLIFFIVLFLFMDNSVKKDCEDPFSATIMVIPFADITYIATKE